LGHSTAISSNYFISISLYLVRTGVSSFYNSEGTVKNFENIKSSLSAELVRIGMNPSSPKIERTGPPELLNVHLDGCIIGTFSSAKIEEAVNYLRTLKLLAHSGVCICHHVFC
jgi:DNA-directed RNA polymerase I subunit RPA2